MVINIITLGCSKNLVDSEYLLRQFKSNNFTIFHDEPDIQSDVVILNTCGFILDAKQESIENILFYLDLKKVGHINKVFVMGCLSERYRVDLENEMPEVDGFFGVWDHRQIVEAAGGRFFPELMTDRYTTTPAHFAFLKIAEGCNRSCAFCAIPGIRGPQQSRTLEDLKEEAENLVGRGAKELMLIAQDITNYGTDLYKGKALGRLLKELLEIDGLEWIRLHYAYPAGFPLDVIELMASEERICNYIDIPIQHISDNILRKMQRGHSSSQLKTLLERFRSEVPGMAIRTTVLVGFPGETEEEFNELCDFIRTFRFERLGVFPYSHEEDTPAGDRLVDDIPDSLKRSRMDRIMEIQQQISLELNEARIGKELKVLIDREEDDFFIGRTEYDSPEVDNEVLVDHSDTIRTGEFYSVKITGADEFDLFGQVI